MKKIIYLGIILMLTSCGSSTQEEVTLPEAYDSFMNMDNIIGCLSDETSQRKEDVFNEEYLNHWVTWEGEVVDVDEGRLTLKCTPKSLSSDAFIDFDNREKLKALKKGSWVTVKFVLKRQGGCFANYSGDNGDLLKMESSKFDGKYADYKSDDQAAQIENEEEEYNSVDPSTEFKSAHLIGGIITKDIYVSNENGLKTYLKFEGTDGSGGIFGSLTLSNNASSCKYVYTYSIDENDIDADFFQSDCNADADDQTFTYNKNSNTVSCYINGQLFVFNSIF